MANYELDSHLDEVLLKLAMATNKALHEIGMVSVGHAQVNLQKQNAIDTGALMNSITHQVDDHDVYVGTNIDYAIYVEMGTGKHALFGGRQTPWAYMDDNGVWHRTEGMRPRPYLKPAVTEHVAEYAKILKQNLIDA